MSDSKTSPERLSSMGADLSSVVSEAVHKVRPAMAGMAERLNDRLQEMAQHAKEAVIQTEHQLEEKARHTKKSAEQAIAHAPLKSVLIAAGAGAVVALVVSWMVQKRQP